MFSPDKKYIIVNYHYVRNPDPKWPGIKPCSLKEFNRQIRFIAKNFKIVSVEDVYLASVNKKEGNFCAITFDDGLKDHYVNVAPLFLSYGINATFFIITSTLDGHLPLAHKLHILLSKVSPSELIDMFLVFINLHYPEPSFIYQIPRDKRLSRGHIHDSVLVANFKERILSLPKDVCSMFLEYCLSRVNINKKDMSVVSFMNKYELLQLNKRGFIIGAHSHGHYVLDVMSTKEAKEDIQLCSDTLRSITGRFPNIFSYPHGRYSNDILQILIELGFGYGVTIKNKELSPVGNNLLIPRYDTNKIKEYLDKNKIK